MKKRVLITGGAGFIGSHTAAALVAAGHAVRVLDCLDPQVHGPSPRPLERLEGEVELVVGDVRDASAIEAAVRDVDAVYHFAALTGVAQSMYEIRRYMDVNLNGTAALWDAIANGASKVGKVILASSRAVYGEGAYRCEACDREAHPRERSREQLERGEWDFACAECGDALVPAPTREDAPLRPLSVYAQSKRFQEELCRTVAGTYGVELVVLRYFNVYGPGQSLSNPYTGIAPVFCSRLLAGKPAPLYEDGRIVRDFVHVDDVVAANLAALEGAGGRGGPLNVGSGTGTTVEEMARGICSAMGLEERVAYTGQFRAGDIRACVADTSRARAALGYEPAVTFEEGIRGLVDWLASQRGGVDRSDEATDALERKGLIGRAQGPGAAGTR